MKLGISAAIGLLASVILLAACGEPSSSQAGDTEELGGESIEYKLAVIDADGYVAQDDIAVTRFRSLLDQISRRVVENPETVAGIAVKSQEILRENGIAQSMLSTMEGLNQVLPHNVENQKYAEYSSVYVAQRIQGTSHEDAINGLRALLQGIGVD